MTSVFSIKRAQKLPIGILGNLGNYLLVKKQLNAIFDYRYQKPEELFGKLN